MANQKAFTKFEYPDIRCNDCDHLCSYFLFLNGKYYLCCTNKACVSYQIYAEAPVVISPVLLDLAGRTMLEAKGVQHRLEEDRLPDPKLVERFEEKEKKKVNRS